MTTAWKVAVVQHCQVRWDLAPHRIRGLLEELEVLVATDQLSEFSIAGVLSGLGIREPSATEGARIIRSAIGSTRSRAAPAAR